MATHHVFVSQRSAVCWWRKHQIEDSPPQIKKNKPYREGERTETIAHVWQNDRTGSSISKSICG